VVPPSKRPGWTKRNIRVRDATFELFEHVRKGHNLTRTAAFDAAMREWAERKAAAGDQAELVAPALEEVLERRIGFLEDRLVKLLVKCGILTSTSVELFLEQRRRNGHDTTALLREIRDRVYRRWKDPRTFTDTDPDPKSYGKEDES
jgi:hypothetical protein